MKKNFFEINKDGEIKKASLEKKKKKTKENVTPFWGIDYLNIGFYLVTPIVVGVILGLLIDARFKTKPTFTVVLILVGAVASLYNLIKLTKK